MDLKYSENLRLIGDKMAAAQELAKHVARDAADNDLDMAIGDLDRLIQTVNSTRNNVVGLMRDRGDTWQQIGNLLGTTRQSAQMTYGHYGR